ncbi:MAG: putative selenocysteine system protein [Promethearchaeota archaeon]
MGLLQEFMKINKIWPSKSLKVPYSSLSKLEMFELGYYAASDVPFRCFSIKLNPGNDHLKDVALLFNSASKQFISILNHEEGLVITLFESNDANLESHMGQIESDLTKFIGQLTEKSVELRDQLTKCILVERKLDEAMHLALSNEVSRRVYFAIGECRERAALIPTFQNSKGADLVQLALHKWMDASLNFSQDQTFPQEKIKGLVKNFLQIKKWLKELIGNQLAGISTLREVNTVE